MFTNALTLPNWNEELYFSFDNIDISLYDNTGINYDKIMDKFKDRMRNIVKNVTRSGELDIEVNDTRLANGAKFVNYYNDDGIDEQTAKKNFDICTIKNNCLNVYEGKFYRCSVAVKKGDYLRNIGKPISNEFAKDDGISLHNPFLEERIRDYMNSDVPLQSCLYCNGSEAESKPMRQYTTSEIKFYRKKTNV